MTGRIVFNSQSGVRVIQLTVTLLLAVGSLFSAVQKPVREEISIEQVGRAIERAVDFLKDAQAPDGLWPDRAVYQGGLTPLCTLALLHAGCPVDDPAVKQALVQLRAWTPKNTYGLALQTMVFCRADPREYRALIARNVLLLRERQITEGEQSGMWSKLSSGSLDHTDNSMTHFAILGLYEAERVGIPVDRDVWKLTLDYWERSQNPDGSWGWGPEFKGTGSMTCAGIAAITIASGQLGAGDATIENGQVQCCGEQTQRPSMRRAISWLEKHFIISGNPGMKFWHSYYLYSLERAGQLTGRRFFGKHDWYREGAALLVRAQDRHGAWPDDVDEEYVKDELVSTAFSLMFLSKARRPIIVSHLQHLPQDDWNRHRSGLFNLVTYVEKLWKMDLTHQVIDIHAASVEELLESPILFIQGKDALQLSDEEKLKLRQYVERGGFIFAEQCCNGTFDAAFRKLMQELFPEPDAQLRPLLPEHLVWFSEKPIKPLPGRELWGVEYGCRTSVIYAPGDLSCYWELARAGRESELPNAVLPAIEEARAIGANVLAYATNRQIQFRNPAAIAAHPEAEPPVRGHVQVARILHLGGCDAAPQALQKLLRIGTENFGIAAGAPPAIRLTDPALFRFPTILISGRSDFRLTAAEQTQLRLYVERGGRVFGDAVGSSEEFAKAFRREFKQIFPNHPLKRIPISHALFSDDFGGTDITTVKKRKAVQSTENGSLISKVEAGEPILEGIQIDDRYSVIFSPYDLSCTLDSKVLMSFDGYENSDAARIAINILLYLL